MIIEHLILARDSSVDRDKNTLSVFDFLEDVQVEAPKGAKVRIALQVITVIGREDHEVGEVRANFVLTAVSPLGTVLTKNDLPVVMASGQNRQRMRMNLAIEAVESGSYVFKLAKGDDADRAREISFRLSMLPRIGQA